MKKFCLLVCVVLMTIQAHAWGPLGHRVIAALAYEYIDSDTRAAVDQLLGTRGIIYWASWPDEIRNDTVYQNTFNWHFQDLNGGMSDSALIATLTDYPKEGGGLWRATDSLIAVLKVNNEDKDALRFIVHFSGDRFCPMHTAHIDDLGGNKVEVEWFEKHTNLHKVWDERIIETRLFSYTEYVTYLIDKYEKHKSAIESQSRADELRYNYNLTESIYEYHKTWDGNAYKYAYVWRDKLDYQLYCAGVKLAKLLNELYGR